MFSLSHRKFESGPFWPKRSKMGVFSISSKTAHWNFLIFAGSLVSGMKKYYSFGFSEKFGKWLFWPKLTQIWPKFGHLARWNRRAKSVSINNFVI